MENLNFKIAALGIPEKNQKTLQDAALTQGFDCLWFDDILHVNEFLEKYEDQIVLMFIDHRPLEFDAFKIRASMMKNFRDIPTVFRMQGLLRFEDMDQIISLEIKRVISEFMELELIETIKKYNYKQDLIVLGQIREGYILECKELLEAVESSILELEAHPSNLESLNKLFRTVHTIKGSSRVMRWKEFDSYLHAYENLLSEVNSGHHEIDQNLAAVMLKGFDRMVELVESLSADHRIQFSLEQWLDELKFSSDMRSAEISTENAIRSETVVKSTKVQGTRTIKVPIDSLSKLSYFVAAMLENQKKCHALVRAIGQDDFVKKVAEIDKIICEIEEIEKDMLLNLEEVRCVSLKSVFQPYPRVVRDLGRLLSKQVDIEFKGDDIRVDNTIASVLSNSLIHLVRNCIDHGIETVESRIKSNKNPIGLILIQAQKIGDDVTIIVRDDGNGIDVNRIMSQAIKRKIYTEEALGKMSSGEIINIIFAPGFSTSETVGSISGRGVGMDMVKNTVESVGGVIRVESEVGKGSRFILEFHGTNSVIYF